jgi:hypothetical protein
MDKTDPFWQEIRGSLMVRGNGWRIVVEGLPSHISASEAKELLQSPEQLALSLSGQGHIAGELVETRLDKDAVLPFLGGGKLTLENVALQWLYRFLVVEGLCEHARRSPLAGWPPMFLHMVDQGLHFLTYMAAMLVLLEEKRLVWRDPSQFESMEPLVRERIAQACEFLHPKAQDYGESFRRHGLPGILPRLWDKIARYVQLKADHRTGNFEKREDSARDLLGYCCIAYSLMLELPEDVRKGYQPTAAYETESNVSAGALWKKVR